MANIQSVAEIVLMLVRISNYYHDSVNSPIYKSESAALNIAQSGSCAKSHQIHHGILQFDL